MIAASVPATEWVSFFKHPQSKVEWVYDREGITYFKEKEIIGLFSVKDKNFPKIWFKSRPPDKERRLIIEMDCSGRSGRLFDDKGNLLYEDNVVDFIYGHPFRPDSVLEALHGEICLGKSEKEKEKRVPSTPSR
jgi:hypothetical protein